MVHPFKIKVDVYNYDGSQLLVKCTTEELLSEYDSCRKILTKEKWVAFFKSLPLLDAIILFVSLWFFLHGERELSPIGIGTSIGVGVVILSEKWKKNQVDVQKINAILKEIRLILRDRDIQIE